ncbi:hypothetical protein [Methanobacterium formicicum]|uniref:SAP domain-containing protein n=1 Tax=Methanobacterium formicicum TaxID=2162 RepID=A0A090IAT8_METFO|nr:hypothetical protein [Methanobacterium formicicum]MDH2658531.1 hypothetical protein [Methanobacterium formicicum]CEA14562.1 hypothetical protein DSM1535_2242 [Methanobacterium formicicum]
MNGEGEGNSEAINENDVSLLIDLTLSHNNREIQEFLKSKELTFSGNTQKLRERLRKYYDSGDVTVEEIIALLDQLEEYGNQHIYLFTLPENYLSLLRDEESLRLHLERHEILELYNEYQPLFLPENPEIISINHDLDWFKIRWGVKKEDFGTPIEKNIIQEDDGQKYLIQKFLIKNIRETTLFQVSMVNGDAELLIHRSTDSNYEQEKEKYMNQIYEIFNWDPLNPIELNPAIVHIEASGEVRTRNINLQTPRMSNIEIVSPSKEQSINDDPDALTTRNSVNMAVGRRGNFYWLPERSNDALRKELYTRIYPDRFSVYGERHEEEVNYVIGRIRHHLP